MPARHGGREKSFEHSTTESVDFGSLKRYHSGFGNVSTASAAVAAAPAAAFGTLAVAAAGYIPQCLAAGH